MGQKKSDRGGLGRSLVRSRFGKQIGRQGSDLHTALLDDGVPWANKASITDQNDIEQLLHVADLARIEFTAERASPSLVVNNVIDVRDVPQSAPIDRPKWLRIPRRPSWRTDMTANELHILEQNAFLDWRRELARLEDSQHFIITPFERNLEVWRQLWRVVEACSLVVQIVDARNPLLFYCEDLLEYAKELDTNKRMLLVINKADFLTTEQRSLWASHFSSAGISFVFFSAKLAGDALDCELDAADGAVKPAADDVLSRYQLLEILKEQSADGKVGMIGYPNVGKSSTINALAGVKKVAVAATPGKTKHFQTVHLPNKVTLYDCPGLVLPNFAASKGDLVLNGILPIDQLRDWIQPSTLLITKIPRNVIEATYGIELPKPGIDDNPDRLPTYSEVLSTFAAARGYRTSFHGNPDESRAARVLLKDFVNGKLLYCAPPPVVTDDFAFNKASWLTVLSQASPRMVKLPDIATADANLTFDSSSGVRMSGPSGTSHFSKASGNSKKHYKGNKRR